ncbi:MAG: endonuclease/exonuclease/phosphatase family protein [Chitinophagales bacterium]
MKWWHKIFLVITILVLVLLIGSYIAMYVSPESFLPLAFIGLGYFPLLIIYLLFLVIWFFIRKKVFYVLFLFLLPGFKAHLSYFSAGSLKKADTEGKTTYKILQYNIQGFDAYNKKGKYLHREEILENILKEKPDIICLEEFNTYHNHPTEKSNLDMVLNGTGLEYYYYYKAYENSKATRSFGLIILSRFPVVDSGHLEYLSLSKLNSTIYADLKINNDTIRVFCSHLQSTQLSHYDLEFIEASNEAESDFDADRVTNKLKMSYALRAQEVDSISIYLKRSPHPIISCGDFNDTPVSYVYRIMSEDLQDAFLQRGFGIGATYSPMPLVRIDYQLFDEDKFEITDFKRIKENSSDHYPCITTFTINSD